MSACAHTQFPETSSSIENLSALGAERVQGLSSSQRFCVQGFSSSQCCVQVPGAGTQGAVPMLSTGIALTPLAYTPHSPIAPGGAPTRLLHSLQRGSSNTAATDQLWTMEMRGQILLSEFLPAPPGPGCAARRQSRSGMHFLTWDLPE